MKEQQTDKYPLLLNRLGAYIQQEMKRQHLDQADLAAQSQLSQATISNIINGKDNISMKKYFIVMDTLHMDQLSVLNVCTNEVRRNTNTIKNAPFQFSSENFICDPSSYVFNGQMGKFYILFHSTNRNDNKLLHGTLHLYSGHENCLAELDLLTEDIDNSNSSVHPHKKYNGFAVISLIQTAVYILLINEEIGELCFLVYPYKQILRNGATLECTMAIAATISSGIDSRVPTAHRIFLSRKECTKETEKYISGQLLLNKSLIQISKPVFEKICISENLSDEFIQHFYQYSNEHTYFEIDEDNFKQLVNKNRKYFQELCILRNYSLSPKNNKIGYKLINNIFQHLIVNR